jgi:CheY-like chemotaxis protein
MIDSSRGNASMGKKAIVCVDDEAIIVHALKHELSNYFGDQYLYECAMNASEALLIIDELMVEGIEIAVIITDWLMPGTKGDELLIQIREKHGDIKSIMITGQADQAAIDRAKNDAGVSIVLEKPWLMEDLIGAIQSCQTD